jgi:DNA mismatch endonuclease, patch repair protein
MRTKTSRAGKQPVAAVTSARMKAVRQRDTAPEQAVRKVLREIGASYRVCPRDLPGRPDIANKAKAWCVFVHGCFWHGHEGCALARLPKNNHTWWSSKIEANRERDLRKESSMRSLGFRIAVIWQCELRDVEVVRRTLSELVTPPGRRRARRS